MSDIAIAVVSVARTRRRRFHWAAWWTAAPAARPFRAPDAHGGGARTREEALLEAERVAGRTLTPIEPRWAQAWSRVMQGEPVWPRGDQEGGVLPRSSAPTPISCWEVLGVPANASLADIKRGYRQRALATHPDRGGDALAFREVQRAYERAIKRRRRSR